MGDFFNSPPVPYFQRVFVIIWLRLEVGPGLPARALRRENPCVTTWCICTPSEKPQELPHPGLKVELETGSRAMEVSMFFAWTRSGNGIEE